MYICSVYVPFRTPFRVNNLRSWRTRGTIVNVDVLGCHRIGAAACSNVSGLVSTDGVRFSPFLDLFVYRRRVIEIARIARLRNVMLVYAPSLASSSNSSRRSLKDLWLRREEEREEEEEEEESGF